MVSAMTNTHHTINYIELPATDLAGSKAFYERAFGWQFNEYGPKYAGIKSASGDGEVGGLDAAEPNRRTPLVLLYSDDLDASVAAVTAAGGAVVQGPYGFPGGRRFHFTDPSGTELAVWASS